MSEVRAKTRFQELCDLCERNGLMVELWRRDHDGVLAIWVLPSHRHGDTELEGVDVQVRTATVASPFVIGTKVQNKLITIEMAVPQLIQCCGKGCR